MIILTVTITRTITTIKSIYNGYVCDIVGYCKMVFDIFCFLFCITPYTYMWIYTTLYYIHAQQLHADYGVLSLVALSGIRINIMLYHSMLSCIAQHVVPWCSIVLHTCFCHFMLNCIMLCFYLLPYYALQHYMSYWNISCFTLSYHTIVISLHYSR